ncbi:hypothetical protein KKF84_00620 [Myxococcota bacterium]|nr:hypothetical protein [Myxococcota bacterium]MBU1533788.1 hypothetical protein [Myxococcota bacterium]
MHILLITLFFTMSAVPTLRDTLLTEQKAGQITPARRLSLLEQAVKQPRALPQKYRELLNQKGLGLSATATLIEVYQQRRILGIAANPLKPPKWGEYFFDSAVYPIRVYYSHPSFSVLAETTLHEAEHSWEQEVIYFGFYAPRTMYSDRYEIYFDNCGDAGGYMSPGHTIPETPWDDCTSYICISDNMSAGTIGPVVAHEMSHATQGAMDCMEALPIWENTSMYMMNALYPGSAKGFGQIYSFQERPNWSLADGAAAFRQEGIPYIYDGFIWPLYLSATYGEGPEDAFFVRDIWEASMQEKGSNTVGYLKAIDNLLSELGSSLEEAFLGFSTARYFVDSNTNPYHSSMPYHEFISPPPPVINSFGIGTEYVYSPPASLAPKPYGVNYYILSNPDTCSYPMTIKLYTETSEKWALAVVPLEHDTILFQSGWQSPVTLEFDPSIGGDMLLMVMNLGSESFTVNSIPSLGTPYQLIVAPTNPLPEVTMVTPDTISQGEELTLIIRGTGFVEGISLDFLPRDQIEVRSLTFVSESELSVTLHASQAALTGGYFMEATNPDSGFTSTENGLWVEESEPAPPKKSSGCSTAQGGAGGSTSLIFLLLLLALRRRHNR